MYCELDRAAHEDRYDDKDHEGDDLVGVERGERVQRVDEEVVDQDAGVIRQPIATKDPQ